MIFDAKEYKFAKVVANDLEQVLQIIAEMEPMIRKLEPYRRYTHVTALLKQFQESKLFLNIQFKKYSEIKDKKGAKK
jgi:hypothetical protein